MKVLVVSGFLGAGKTTFIQELIHHLDGTVAVYENEFGTADVDAAHLRNQGTGSVWESLEDCICCTGGKDFASTFLAIAGQEDPDWLIVEPTGVAELSGVLANAEKVAYSQIEILPAATIVDAMSWKQERAAAQELFSDQIAHAAHIAISKAGLAGFGSVEEVRTYIEGLNPSCDIVRTDCSDPGFWARLQGVSPLAGGTGTAPEEDLASLEDEHEHHVHHHDHHEHGFETKAICDVWLPTPAHLVWLLDAMAEGAFGAVTRAKGIVTCGNEPIRFDYVSGTWAVTGEQGEAGSRTAVFIGQDLHGLEDFFKGRQA
ncbi:MAG: GTP-binding protein [Atopobiaceae bacterium]